MIRLIAATIFALTCLSLAQGPRSVDLADLRGWDIVLSPDATASEVYAATEFQQLYKQASGRELPIARKTERPDRHIFIGPGEAMQSAPGVGFSVDGMGEEALRIIVSPTNITIAGGRPRGTLYGVYTFVEDYLGARFLTPDHTHVPTIRAAHPVASVDRTYEPQIEFRWSYWNATNQNGGFASRTRCNATPISRPEFGGASNFALINHSLHRYISTHEYGKLHPEYFALVDGSRRADLNATYPGVDATMGGTQLCMSNPDVRKLLTTKILEELHDNPQKRLIQLGQGDNEYYCRCQDCAAIDAREETHMGALLTGINRVAEAVEKEFPDVIIGTLAYKYSRKPPKTLHAHPNVQIQLCSIECSVTKSLTDQTSKRNVEFMTDLKRWNLHAKRISIWTYTTNFWEFLLPGPTLRTLDDNIKTYVASGVTQFFVQGNTKSPGGAFADVTNYVVSRLLWDPSLDGDELINEFLTLHYGPAAPAIGKYIDQFTHNVDAKRIDRHCYGRGADFGIDEQMIAAGLAASREALALCDNDELRSRVELFRLWMCRSAVEDAWVIVDPRGKPGQQAGEEFSHWMARIGVAQGAIPPDIQQRTRVYISEMIDLCRKHNVSHWREGMPLSRAEQFLRHGFGLAKDESW